MPVDNSGQEAAAAAVDELLDEDEDEDEGEADDESDLVLLDPLSLEESLPDDEAADLLAPAEDFESERASFR